MVEVLRQREPFYKPRMKVSIPDKKGWNKYSLGKEDSSLEIPLYSQTQHLSDRYLIKTYRSDGQLQVFRNVFRHLQGYRQMGRHDTLTVAFVGSIPATPVYLETVGRADNLS